MREYLVIYEQAPDGGWGAYAPDLPGLGVVGESLQETEELIREGITIHLAGLKEDGLTIPIPISRAERVAVPV